MEMFVSDQCSIYNSMRFCNITQSKIRELSVNITLPGGKNPKIPLVTSLLTLTNELCASKFRSKTIFDNIHLHVTKEIAFEIYKFKIN